MYARAFRSTHVELPPSHANTASDVLQVLLRNNFERFGCQ